MRISACEKPLSTSTSATATTAVGIAMTPRMSRVSRRRIIRLTAIWRSIVPIFSAMLHATPRATLSFSSPFNG